MKKSPSKAQIVVTLGPSSNDIGVFSQLVEQGADVARLNFSWGNHAEKSMQVQIVREAEKRLGRHVPIIGDLPGPRVQGAHGHTYERGLPAVTREDEAHLRYMAEEGIDYVAVSFVGGAADITRCRDLVRSFGGTQKIMAKIERKDAVDAIDEIIAVSDAVMVARGDLGSEFPLEEIPFIQARIIEKCRKAKKPVVTATEMLLSMTERERPTRAEVTDVANAILQGSDAVMLSEETASGHYPALAVGMMEKIVLEAERHLGKGHTVSPL